MRLVLASGNPGKLAELDRILRSDMRLRDLQLLSGADLALPDVEESGATFADNALLKARAAADASGLPSLADDSGLVVDALDGEPGVRSARYAGRHGDDEANLRLLLRRLQGARDRGARFVCVAALATPDGRTWTAEGVLDGVVTREPRGVGGFGYDPIFQPLGSQRTTAQMTAAEKDAISHRGKALRGICEAVARLRSATAGAEDQSPPPRSTA